MGKNKGLGMVSALAVGAGVAALAAGKKYKTAETKKKEEYDWDEWEHQKFRFIWHLPEQPGNP